MPLRPSQNDRCRYTYPFVIIHSSIICFGVTLFRLLSIFPYMTLLYIESPASLYIFLCVSLLVYWLLECFLIQSFPSFYHFVSCSVQRDSVFLSVVFIWMRAPIFQVQYFLYFHCGISHLSQSCSLGIRILSPVWFLFVKCLCRLHYNFF